MNSWIGTDESGKGDYFGGLVIAGVVVDNTTATKLKELGVKDSKKLSDSKVKSLSNSIQKLCTYDIVVINPPKYNELYSKLHNLNRILAWGHARVIENLLSRMEQKLPLYSGINECDTAIADKFGDKKYIEKALMTRGKSIKLVQRPKAEDNIAVAAASVVARNRFVMELEKLSTQIEIQLPKGAGQQVDEVAQSLVEKYGHEILKKIAKVHFKTSLKFHVSGNVGSPKGNKLKRLWAPWRSKYIHSPSQGECIFCRANSRKDEESFVLYRGTNGLVIMNIFPYNNGHLMVAPTRHVASIEELTKEEVISIFDLVQKSVKVLRLKMEPHGFNIGLNIGRIAGAGIEYHLHIHIVPRWAGDTNFMPVVSDTKVISQSLDEAYELLKGGFEEI